MIIKPPIFPEYAREDQNTGALGGANIVEPSESLKDSGWIYDEYPPAEIFNWLHRYTYLWLMYHEQTNNEVDSYFRNQW